MAIGICDWGIGGAGIYKLLRQHCSSDVVYLSDTGYTPYGKVPEAELRQRMAGIIGYFKNLGIQQVIVACNAASTVIPQDANISGVIEHGIRLARRVNPAEIAVVGGIRTIESGIYKTALEAAGMRVQQRVAQPLSARIEAGDLHSAELDADIAGIFAPIKQVPCILLACTHYPLIAEQIRAYTGPVQLLDPAAEMCSYLLQHWKPRPGNNSIRWQTTGDTTQMRYTLGKAYALHHVHIEKTEL